MYLILDLHAAPGGQGYGSDINDYNPNLPSLWESEENKNKTIALCIWLMTYCNKESSSKELLLIFSLISSIRDWKFSSCKPVIITAPDGSD